jgi:hypothetical protein
MIADNRRLEYVIQRDRERREAWLRFVGLTAEAYQRMIFQYTFSDTFELVKMEPTPECKPTFEELERLHQMMKDDMLALHAGWGRVCDDAVFENEKLNRMENVMKFQRGY